MRQFNEDASPRDNCLEQLTQRRCHDNIGNIIDARLRDPLTGLSHGVPNRDDDFKSRDAG